MWQTNEMNLNSKFHNNIVNKYQIYNSLFLTLPYENIKMLGCYYHYWQKTAMKVLS